VSQPRARWAAVVLFFLSAATAGAQSLTLADAIARARTVTPEARSAAAAAGEAAARVAQAQAGYLPRVDLIESIQRGNQPVFVFSSLLSQRRFEAADFALQSLNHPSPVTNVRSSVLVEQPVFDGGATRFAVRSARIASDLAVAAQDAAGQDLALQAAAAFVRVLQLDAEAGATQAAIDAAQSDRDRAAARRDSGIVTDADVLAVEVHLAEMRARRITAIGDLAIARIALNTAIGAPLDDQTALAPPAAPGSSTPIGELLVQARSSSAEQRQAALRAEAAAAALASARSAFLPRVLLQGGLEADGSSLTDQQANWVVGASVQLNVFRGGGDAARVREARFAQTRAEADRQRVERDLEVDVRAAGVRLDTARAREQAGRAALAQAVESRRIVRERYEAGLATITDVLRAAGAVLDAEARASASGLTVVLEAVALERAIGRL
jgi:outer membrane protein